MKSKESNTSELNWSSSLTALSKKNQTPLYLAKLNDARVFTLSDLLWIFPLRVQNAPKLQSFSSYQIGSLVLGEGNVVSVRSKVQFGRKGKGRSQLFQIDCLIKDKKSENYLLLKWFNAYPSQVKSLKSKKDFFFQGELTTYQDQVQIINPQILKALPLNEELIIEYPTINGVSGNQIKKIIQKIPIYLWDNIPSFIPKELISRKNFMNLSTCFKVIHGLNGRRDEQLYQEVISQLVYLEFFKEQLMFKARKESVKEKQAQKFSIFHTNLEKLKKSFPYQLTGEQNTVLNDVIEDLDSGHPMSRMLQGDVGSGKTTVAFLAANIIVQNKKQVAIMSPTETLAKQHYHNYTKFFPKQKETTTLLIGSQTLKVKKEKYEKIKQGDTLVIIGTHTLFQKALEYKDLSLMIIDEQHKFGVKQRISLANKGHHVHTLLMSATPIPRTLSLTQFGDLDISIIKEIPNGRKGVKTKIVLPHLMSKYLSFLKTRLSLQEQIYIVCPAIEESEKLDIANVEAVKEQYQSYFPEVQIEILHGKKSSEEKDEILEKFLNKKTQILVSTSVIEVGIDIHNTTVMSIYNPERFGLSSLHQLRGRVGRGQLPGFCFLVTDSKISPESLERLKIIESTHDGFKIAEADLEFRGQGDLFGSEQSGEKQRHKIANIIKHQDILYHVCSDIQYLRDTQNPIYNQLIKKMALSDEVSSTI